MGVTESSVTKNKLDRQYRLVRRFVSQMYGCSEVTVVEHKQTKQQFVLKEFIQQFSSEKLTSELQIHRSMSHKNLIQLKHFWIENDLNICSSLFKVFAIMDYHQLSLQEWIEEMEEPLSDLEISDFIRQIECGLSFQQRNRGEYLLGGAKSIAVVKHSQLQELRQRQLKIDSHRKSVSRLFQQSRSGTNRRSLIDINRCVRPVKEETSKKIFKIFDPIDGVMTNRSLHSLQTFLQVPLHPDLWHSPDYLLTDIMVKQQNILTLSLMAMSMCMGCDISELDIFKGGRVSISLVTEKMLELKQNFPRTSKELTKIWNDPFCSLPGKISQGLKIKDISLIKKRTSSKNYFTCQEDKENMRDGRVLSKKGEQQLNHLTLGRKSSKRISLMQV